MSWDRFVSGEPPPGYSEAELDALCRSVDSMTANDLKYLVGWLSFWETELVIDAIAALQTRGLDDEAV